MIEVGMHLVYVDSNKRDRPAIVLAIHGGADRPKLDLAFASLRGGKVAIVTNVPPIPLASGTSPMIELHPDTGKPVLDKKTGKKKIIEGKPNARDAGHFWRL